MQDEAIREPFYNHGWNLDRRVIAYQSIDVCACQGSRPEYESRMEAYLLNSYPTVALEHERDPEISAQYPSVPKVM